MGEIKSAVDFLDQFFGSAVAQSVPTEVVTPSAQDDQPPEPDSNECEGGANILARACLRAGATPIGGLAPHPVEEMVVPATTGLLPASNSPVLTTLFEEHSEFIEIAEDDLACAYMAHPRPFSLDMDDFAIPEPQQAEIVASSAIPMDFLTSLDPLIFEAISRAEELSIDVETSVKGTPWSPAEAPGKAAKLGTGQTIGQYMKAHGATLDARPRMRVLSIGAAGWKGAFDLDKMSESDKMELLGLLDGKVWVGHNLAFDLLWIKHTAPEVNPKMLLDTMFLATAIRPDIERMIHERIVSTTIGGQQPVRLAGKNAGTVEQELQKILIERSASKNGKDDDAKSAYPLATLSLVFLNEKMDKSFQNSTNWMPSVLTNSHLDYCIGDITAPAIIARRMLNLPDEAPIAGVIAALDIKKVPGAWAYLRAFEPAARRLVDCTLKGIPLSKESIAAYRDALQGEADVELEKVLKMADELGTFRDRLRLKPGMTNDLKEAYAAALHRRTGLEVERSEVKKSDSPEDDQQELIDFEGDDLSGQKKGALRLGSDYLKERFHGEPLVEAMQSLSGVLKRRDMIDDYAVYAGGDGRVHGTITVGTITGRTRSSNPNMQNAPRNAAFRACFAATPGHQILAIDYSAMELRIAAALGARAYGQFLKMMENPHKSKVKWILKMPDMMDYIQGKKPLPGDWPLSKPDYMAERKPSISDYGLAYGSQLAAICRDLRVRGAEFRNEKTDYLTFREVFRAKLDPHILTAVSMESSGGRYDTGGLEPLDYLKRIPYEEAKLLKKTLAGPRQAAKPVAFGLIYGMSVQGLHSSGITGYGLSWALEEAAEAAQAFFSLYPEVAMWHWMTAHAGGKTKSHVFDTRRNECKTDGDGGSFYRGRTLSGRVVEGLELREALNYSDQGTGGEIALHAISQLSNNVAKMLVGFVHDELIFEVPTNQADAVSKEVERVMNEAAEALLLLYKATSEVEAALGEHWIH